MTNMIGKKGGLMPLGLVVLVLGGGFGCKSDPGVDDGTGGSPEGTGGDAQGTGGQGGTYACNEQLTGSGGAIGLPNCDAWLGSEGPWVGVESAGPLDFSCGQGGDGGDSGSSLPPPALQRVCEADSEPDFNGAHPVYFCLDELTDDVCSAGHEGAVTACLTQEAPCNHDLTALGCTPYLDACGALEVGTCFWAMTAARDREFIETCFDAPVEDETCDARFMRCAWGL